MMSTAPEKVKVRGSREAGTGLAEAMSNAHALVVGIANYVHLNQLPEIVLKDARDIHQLLIDRNHCAYPNPNVELLLDEEATRPALQEALARLARRCNEESTVFFYISSHGCSIESGRFAG